MLSLSSNDSTAEENAKPAPLGSNFPTRSPAWPRLQATSYFPLQTRRRTVAAVILLPPRLGLRARPSCLFLAVGKCGNKRGYQTCVHHAFNSRSWGCPRIMHLPPPCRVSCLNLHPADQSTLYIIYKVYSHPLPFINFIPGGLPFIRITLV
jgi:hypothetical protein